MRTRQILSEVEAAERVTLQPGVTSNSIVFLKSLLLSSDLCTLLPLLAVAEEVERGDFIAVPVDGAALHGTSIHLISRLGRRLTPAPLSLVDVLTVYLDRYALRSSTMSMGDVVMPRGTRPSQLAIPLRRCG